MKPESEEKSHGEGERITVGNISEAVLNRKRMPGISCSATVERRVYVPKMWKPAWIPSAQWTVSVRPMPPPGIRDGRDGAAQDPSAADKVVSRVLSGVRG